MEKKRRIWNYATVEWFFYDFFLQVAGSCEQQSYNKDPIVIMETWESWNKSDVSSYIVSSYIGVSIFDAFEVY